MKPSSATLAAVLTLTSSAAFAAYTQASSGPVQIDTIYANEFGSPFVTFKTQINAACADGTGLYLYNQEIAQPNTQLRNNKMAILLTAKAANKRVMLDYFFGGFPNDWANCYISGIRILDQ